MSRNPKHSIFLPHRPPTHIQDPVSYDKKHLRIRFDLLDFEHELWGWNRLTQADHIDFLKFVQSRERQTWAEIKLEAGGKKKGTNNHSLEISKFAKRAQDRLRDLNLDRIVGDVLFSLRLNSVTRIYGARDGEYFRPIWHDPYHDRKDRAAYPVREN